MSSPTPRDYADLFEDDKRGAAILEHMIQIFARPPVSDGGIDAVLKTFERGGQRKVLDHIVNQISRAHGVDINQEE